MATVNIHAAKTHLSQLIERVNKGEEIIIARGNKPIARLMPLESKPQGRQPGTLAGKFEVGESFFEPLPPDELDG